MDDTQSNKYNGIHLNVEDSGGEGRPIILIHGWPLSGKSWNKQVPALQEAGYRVITYDRRGFGDSDKPSDGYDYDTFSDDLAGIIDSLGLEGVSLVGFSMGGGEVARYVSRHGEDKLHSIVFAGAVPPYLLKSDDNPDGPLTQEKADSMTEQANSDLDGLLDQFTKDFFSPNADGNLLILDEERQDALEQARKADPTAVRGAMKAFATTDFRDDLTTVTIPTLVIHGDSDGIIPFEGSGKRTHEAIAGSDLYVVENGPHGFNTTHPDEFNKVVIDFLQK
ncbi:alpha/beta fold hydrolase [Candidatus Mycosynbacter amalyticus]|uniref:Alpha/beta fold hydrolase n=1 Tax=Candidatus Mycosynbacter amalyticus TaxID=2665156 RepID=A0A857ML20_9BACT|nr:alpha/beta hydrolase [Candidatus Mycosynbacter amalyticus]QHN42302.1 alpha/beta fold hydrolase [Candidatus Mycosynbacter amalyticus]